MYHEDEGVKFDESISRPGNAIGKGSKRDEKWHVLHAFSSYHQFLHHLNKLFQAHKLRISSHACLIIFNLETRTNTVQSIYGKAQ